MARLQLAAGAGPSAQTIKQVAMRLFAEKGVDGVSVREIAAEAGQKNHGAVGYHFGSKEALVRELVMDGAVELERLRNDALDQLEAEGGPIAVIDVLEALVLPATALADEYYLRFVTIFGMTHRDLLLDAIDPAWNRAYGRCLDHLRALLTHLPPAQANQRFVFMGASISAVLSARERAVADHSRDHPMWADRHALQDFIRSLAAMLAAPAA